MVNGHLNASDLSEALGVERSLLLLDELLGNDELRRLLAVELVGLEELDGVAQEQLRGNGLNERVNLRKKNIEIWSEGKRGEGEGKERAGAGPTRGRPTHSSPPPAPLRRLPRWPQRSSGRASGTSSCEGRCPRPWFLVSTWEWRRVEEE